MKHFLSILFALTFLGQATAMESEEWTPDYWKISSVHDPKLAAGKSVFEFRFANIPPKGSKRMIYSIDGKAYTKNLIDNTLVITTTPGKHIFQFYHSQEFAEVYTDSLVIKNRYHDTYQVQLSEARIIQTYDKPVIYLYPKKETTVSVKMNFVGKTTFTYPLLDESWDFIAFPNGDLQFGEDTYNYLFWESNQKHYLNHVEMTEGFVVEKADVVSFLENTLDQAGLSSKESADFITYWAPRILENELTFIHFEFNETCNKYAKMEITPEPDHIYRIYMSWMGIDEPRNVTPQKIEKMNRNGFTILEWGGSELPDPKSHRSNHPIN